MDMRKVREGLEPWARQWRARGAAEGGSVWRGGPGRRRPMTAGPPSPGHSALWPRPPWRPWHVTPRGGHVWPPACATSQCIHLSHSVFSYHTAYSVTTLCIQLSHSTFSYHTTYSVTTLCIQLSHSTFSYHTVYSVITQSIQLSHCVFRYHTMYSVSTQCIQLAHSVFSNDTVYSVTTQCIQLSHCVFSNRNVYSVTHSVFSHHTMYSVITLRQDLPTSAFLVTIAKICQQVCS